MDDEKKPGTQEQEPALGRVSRRSFLSQLGVAGVVATTRPLAAAIAGGVYHATGVRVRELPIRIEDLIAQREIA